MEYRKQIGNQGEELVARHLESLGYQIVERNYHRFYGEIDLIASKGKEIVFIEVKTRQKNYFDNSGIVTPSKQKKILKVAKEYIMRNGHDEKICRFDIALLEHDGTAYQLTYIDNAFCQYCEQFLKSEC